MSKASCGVHSCSSSSSSELSELDSRHTATDFQEVGRRFSLAAQSASRREFTREDSFGRRVRRSLLRSASFASAVRLLCDRNRSSSTHGLSLQVLCPYHERVKSELARTHRTGRARACCPFGVRPVIASLLILGVVVASSTHSFARDSSAASPLPDDFCPGGGSIWIETDAGAATGFRMPERLGAEARVDVAIANIGTVRIERSADGARLSLLRSVQPVGDVRVWVEAVFPELRGVHPARLREPEGRDAGVLLVSVDGEGFDAVRGLYDARGGRGVDCSESSPLVALRYTRRATVGGQAAATVISSSGTVAPRGETVLLAWRAVARQTPELRCVPTRERGGDRHACPSGCPR